MTNEEARRYLTIKRFEFEKRIDEYYVRQESARRPGYRDPEERLFVFSEINNKKVVRFIANYTLPEGFVCNFELPEILDANFKLPFGVDDNLMIIAIEAYKKAFYKYAAASASKKYWGLQGQEDSLESIRENGETGDGGVEDMRENVEDSALARALDEATGKAMNIFEQLLQPREKALWHAVARRERVNSIAEWLYKGAPPTPALIEKVRYQVNILEYRFACVCIARQVVGDAVGLTALNKYPPQNKIYFKAKKLTELPTEAELMEAAKGKVCKSDIPSVVQPTKKYSLWMEHSKTDFNGKVHDHFVVYRSRDTLYDHVTKTTRSVEESRAPGEY